MSVNRSFNWLWFATGCANLGDGMTLFVLPLLALAGDASTGEVAMVATVSTLAWPIFGLHAGWIVDKIDRRAILVWVNLARASALGLLAAAATFERERFALVLFAAAIYGLAETLVDTALTSVIPVLVPLSGRGPANARIEATINVTNQLAGPPLAGLLAVVSFALATGASSLLYLAAAMGAARIAIRPAAGRSTHARSRESGHVRAGLAYLWNDQILRTLTLITAAMSLAWGAWFAIFVVYAVDPAGLDLTPAQFGLMLTAMAGGGLLASVFAERARRAVGTTTMLLIDCIGTVLLVAPAGFGAPLWMVVAGIVVAGAGSSIWRILVATIRQNIAPEHLLGRVYSASRVISWGALPIGTSIAGLVGERYGPEAVFRVATVYSVFVVIWFAVYAMRSPRAAFDPPVVELPTGVTPR